MKKLDSNWSFNFKNNTIMEDLIEVLSHEIGIKEVKGKEANPQILRYAKESGFETYTSDETAWCSLFANWIAFKVGLERTKDLSARSWLNVGIPIDQPEPGDVVVFWREDRNSWQGHVAFFMGFSFDHSRVYCVGGNQGNQVSPTAYSLECVLGYRRLRKIGGPQFSEKNLKVADTGKEVAHLQDAIKQLGYDCGTSDGVFGSRTEQALKDFQATSQFVNINGVFDKVTR